MFRNYFAFPSEQSLNKIKEELQIQITADNKEAAQAEVLFLSVKPQFYETVINLLGAFLFQVPFWHFPKLPVPQIYMPGSVTCHLPQQHLPLLNRQEIILQCKINYINKEDRIMQYEIVGKTVPAVEVTLDRGECMYTCLCRKFICLVP